MLEAGDLFSENGDAGFPFGIAWALLGEGVGLGGGALVGGPLAAAVAMRNELVSFLDPQGATLGQYSISEM